MKRLNLIALVAIFGFSGNVFAPKATPKKAAAVVEQTPAKKLDQQIITQQAVVKNAQKAVDSKMPSTNTTKAKNRRALDDAQKELTRLQAARNKLNQPSASKRSAANSASRRRP